MRISKLSIRNYKSIRELDVHDFQNLNVFIGKNDAGKSNIIGALDVVFNSNILDYNGSLKVLKEDVVETIFNESLPYQFFNKKHLEAEITVYIDITPHELSKRGLTADTEEPELVVSKKLIGEKDQTKILLDFVRVNKNVIVKTGDEKKRFLTKDGSYSDNFDACVGKQLLESLFDEMLLVPADRNIIRDPHPFSQKMKVETYIKDSLLALANSDDEDKNKLFYQFADFITDMSPMIESIEPIMKNKKAIDIKFLSEKEEDIPLSTIGGGNNELLMLLYEIIISGGRVLAIEEPEIHLHPEAERKLFRFMQEFSQSSQMFVVTHSPIYVEPKSLRGLYRVVKKGIETKLYFMNDTDFVDKDRLTQELNTENCEMFFADKVLLVEGISDKIFMEGLIDRYCKSAAEIKVISSYSKDNFKVYLDLLNIFKIPYVVMTDLDAVKGRYQIKIIWNELKKHPEIKSREEKISFLKLKKIYVLSKGDLERSYPKRFRRGVSKPLDALFAVHNLMDEDYYSVWMQDIREVIEALE
ncbi:MAG: AAA family ATPase [archaeon]